MSIHICIYIHLHTALFKSLCWFSSLFIFTVYEAKSQPNPTVLDLSCFSNGAGFSCPLEWTQGQGKWLGKSWTTLTFRQRDSSHDSIRDSVRCTWPCHCSVHIDRVSVTIRLMLSSVSAVPVLVFLVPWLTIITWSIALVIVIFVATHPCIGPLHRVTGTSYVFCLIPWHGSFGYRAWPPSCVIKWKF